MVDSFGAILRELRQERDMSMDMLALKVGWTKSHIALVETGQRRAKPDFVVACDQVLKSTPFLALIFGLTGEDDDMMRRSMLRGLATALGMTGLAATLGLADKFRLDLQEAAGIEEDWDLVIAGLQRQLTMGPTNSFGEELLSRVLVARQMVAEQNTPDNLRVAAHIGLLYGLHSGHRGNLETGNGYFRTAERLAEMSGDRTTQVYVLARVASAGPYQGLTRTQTQDRYQKALTIAGDRADAGVLEAHAARTHLAALTGDLQDGRDAVQKMWAVAERMEHASDSPTPLQRAASFDAYLEGKLGDRISAEKAFRRADTVLPSVPLWHVEARLYRGLAMIRAKDTDTGLAYALDAAKALPFSDRVVRLAVDDIIRALPVGYRSDVIDELARHGATGPRPWELIST